MPTNLWTRNELILAIKLYCELPFGKIHSRNPEIIKLAALIGRTPSAVSLKLTNFASFDPSLQERNIKGMRNTGKLDKEIWDEFYNDWEFLTYKSAELQSNFEEEPLEKLYNLHEEDLPKEGKERERVIKARVNQRFFRSAVLASYNSTCCITGLHDPNLLIAGHIIPWAEDIKNRLNPRNGLCLNALHDRAYEYGLITITPDYKLRVSKILKNKKDKVVNEFFLKYEDKEIKLPSKFLPDKNLLEMHNARFYEQY